MAQANSCELGPHLLDTGPLLCLGGSPALADLYDLFFGGDGQVVQVVKEEVNGWAGVHVAAGDPRRIGGVKKAATRAAGRYGKTLFASAVPTPSPEPADIAPIRQALESLANQKRPGRTPRENEHAGETFSIYEAIRSGARFASNDDGARVVAGARGVAHESFVDIAKRLARCQQDLRPKGILKELQKLLQQGLDIGGVVNSPLDLT